MGIFSERPKSFKMDRKSPLASSLKSSISDKLLQFLGNYTDDVLAEYIIVLVCNGKHQIQARDDLEAFLGERSGEFVSWLWDHLVKYAHQSNSANRLLDPKDMITSPNSSGAEWDLRRSRSKDVQNRINGNSDSSLTTYEKYCHPSGLASSPVLFNNMELPFGIQHCEVPVAPMNELNTTKAHSKKQRSAILGDEGATEDFHYDSLTYKSSRLGCSSLIATGREQSFEYIDRSKKLHIQLLDFPCREMVSRNSQLSTTEPHSRQIYAANISARNPARAVDELSNQSKKARGSVWDRLGKPCEESVFVHDNNTIDSHAVADKKSIDTHAVDIVETDQEVYDSNTPLAPIPRKEVCGSTKNEGHEIDKSCSSECRKQETGVSMMRKQHEANNIRQKRHFGEISSGPSSCSVSLSGRSSNLDHQHKESSQDFKRLNSKSEAAAPVSQVQDVKQRLREIEMEMSKLRTKQLEMKKGQPHVLSYSGVIKHSEDDVESTTVSVHNVHFAATKEALSLHFAKCGVILNVVILTNILTAQPKGSAYITFANKESVDKAVALSGTSFFSRTLKVLRKAEEAFMSSTTPQHAGKPSQAQSSQMNRKTVPGRPPYPSSHLQWRRDPLSAPSEPSASVIREEGVGSAASQQQLSSSLASMGTTKTGSTETPAAA